MQKIIIYILCSLFSISFIDKSWSQNQRFIDINDFGGKGDGNTNNSNTFNEAVKYAVKEAIPLYIPKGIYLVSPVEFSVDSLKIFGEGIISSYKSNGQVLFKINGNGNSIQGIGFREKDFSRELLNINGNNNSIINVTFEGREKSKSEKVIYSDRLLHFSNLNGKGNIIDYCKFKNGRVGICVNGGFILKNSEITHNIIGVLMRPSSRNSEIYNNIISYNDVNGKAGNDGILAQRNVDNIHIYNNTISYSGEHGIYFQGSNSIIEKNKVFNNDKSGIKLASYNDQLFNYPSDKYYIGMNNIIRDNEVYNNVKANKTNAGIYLQAPLYNIVVENNSCYNNYFGIRTTSVYSKRDDKKRTTLKEISIINNKVNNNRGTSFWIEGESDISIIGNEGENLTTTTKSNDFKMKDFVLENNKLNKVILSNLNGGTIKNNNVREIKNNSNINISIQNLLKDNKILKND